MSEVENKRGGSDEPAESGAAFRVIDRRRFAADGSEREDQAGETAARATPEAKPESAAEPGARDAMGTRGPDFVLSDAENREEAPLVEPTLSTLLLSLSTQALMLLGEIPDLSTGEAQRDLPAARNLIDLIAVLEKKTRGNLDADESALFERILYDLRMRFVEVSRS